MRRRRWAWLAAGLSVSLVLSSCSSDRTDSGSDGSGASSTTAADGSGGKATFGDLTWPCGPATEKNTDDGSETGVTADSIKIATGDDAGSTVSPGLNHEIGDAVKAFTEKCNDLGGIHGRKIELSYHDAKLFEVASAIQAACDEKAFYLVGQGWAFDADQEEIRQGCGLPAVPAYTVSAAFAHADGVFQGVPNPADEMAAAYFVEMATAFPDETKAVGVLAANFGATRESRDKAVAAGKQLGWKFVSTDLEYNISGEADWTPFVRQLKDAKAKMVYFSGSCLPNLQLFAQAAKANGYEPILTGSANFYATSCTAANTDGAMDDMYVDMAYVPLEEADANAATKDYIDLVEGSGGDTALLGLQATSSFLLWAQAASACGSELTRVCVQKNLRATREWTAGGLHAPSDPGGNHPIGCTTILKIEGDTYVRVAPKGKAKFACPDTPTVPVKGVPALDDLELDENRISHQFGN